MTKLQPSRFLRLSSARSSRALAVFAACAAFAAVPLHAQTKAQITAAAQRGVNFSTNDSKRPDVIGCFSCHNTGQVIRAGAMAEKSTDLSVDQPQLNTLISYINNQQYDGAGFWNGAVTHVGNHTSVASFAYTTTAWAMFSLVGIDPATTATPYSTSRFTRGASFMERVYQNFGNVAYPADHVDGPVNSDNPGETARAVMVWARALQLDSAAHWRTTINAAVTYLRSSSPRNQYPYYIQDAAWIIMALNAAGVDHSDAKITSLVSLIKSRQAADGGWSMFTTSGGIGGSDSFATGIAISALLAAGEQNSLAFPAVNNGVKWLLNNQQADGGWLSNISRASGSTWAVLALTELAATPPVITVPADITTEATSAAGAVVTFTVSALDDEDGAVPVTLSKASGSTFAIGTTTVTATATDSSGNSATKSFAVTVRDTTKPVITAPADITTEATSPAGAVATYSATAADSVSGSVTVTGTPPSGSTFAIGSTVVTLTAKDAANNQATAAFGVFVVDTTPPVIAPQATIVAEATSPAGATVSFTRTATDIASPVSSIISSPASGSTFALGNTTVTTTATDSRNNSSTSTFTVSVRDTIAPVISLPAAITVEATGPNGAAVTFAPTATDTVSAVTVTSAPASGSTFPLGTSSVTVTATDAAGNVATGSFNVTVKDTTAPVIAAQTNLTAEATSAAGAVVTFNPTALDLVSGAVNVVASPASGSTFALGETTVTLTATDAAGNSSSSTFTVTVKDTTAPVIAAPSNLTAEATSAAGAVVTFNASATDAVSAATVVTSAASGSTFAIGTTTVTITATDAAGNSSSSTFTVTVKDTTAPVITAPSSQTLEAANAFGSVATFAASATDAVGVTSLTYSHASGSVFAIGSTTVTVTAKDAAGNTSTATFSITVRDTIAPALTLPASQVLEAASAAGTVATFTATATDAVGVTSLTYSPASGSVFPIGTTTVTATARDAAGNTTSGTFTITVQDTIAPALTVPANLVLEATSGAGAAATYAATASDAVGVTSLTYSPVSGSTFALGTTTVTATAKDAAGNTTARTFTVTVRDTTAPTFSTLTPSVASIWPPNHKMVAITLTATTSDIVSAVTTKIISATSNEPDNGLGDGDTAGDIVITGAMSLNLRAERGGNGTGRIYTITVEARDAAGNVSTKTTTVSVPLNQGGK